MQPVGLDAEHLLAFVKRMFSMTFPLSSVCRMPPLLLPAPLALDLELPLEVRVQLLLRCER